MNFDDLRKAFLKGGEIALTKLLGQMKEVMSGAMYNKLVGVATTRLDEAKNIQTACSNWLGGVV